MTPHPLYYAHSENAAHQWHALSDHLRNVAEMARDFAAPLGVAQEAYLAGLLHDLGKYGDRFQRRLQGKERRLDHWASGSVLALTAGHALAASAVIAGHHCGLPPLTPEVMRRLRDVVEHGEPHPDGLRLTTDTNAELWDRFTGDGFVIPPMNEGCCLPGWPATVAAMLDTRMLYSTLVDADYLDTEAHFLAANDGTRYARPAGPPLQADRALEILIAHVEALRAGQRCTAEVQQVRDQLFADCLHAGKEPIGVRTLTAPTGAGKTLAMLAFALQQAATHGLGRIVMVIPYLSIIEQTAAVYRELFAPHFGQDYILEHHSLATVTGEDNEDDDAKQARLLAQNWDAPLIVTTSVQMLESLFAARPAACRKLHRLAESVLLFDEVQSLPETLAVPTLAALAHLAPRYRSTVVFSTATQPAFEHLDAAVRQLDSPGWQPREIVTDTVSMFNNTRRVQVHWPSPDEMTTFPALAAELAACRQVLCVVNLKRHARDLVEALTGVDAVYHLSTGMCPAHRKACLEEVRQRLLAGEPCRLISTQCIEAGVDVDFPCVYRAFAPLEAVAQAAGRCNRNGHRGISAVRVFRPDDAGKGSYPSSDYANAADITALLLRERGADGMDLSDPSLYDAYYLRRYHFTRPEERFPDLLDAFGRADFPAVAAKYRLINQDTINVLTPYDPEQYHALYDEVFARGLRADWMRRAQPFCVAMQRPRNQRDFPLEPCPIDVRHPRGEVSSEWFIAPEHGGYDALLGFAPDHPLVLCC